MKKESKEDRFQDFQLQILQLAGISNINHELVGSNEDFNDIAMTISLINAAKSQAYGKQTDPDDFMTMMESYNELKRKFMRIDHWMRETLNNGQDFNPEELIESYSDLATYSIMGLLTIFELMERNR